MPVYDIARSRAVDAHDRARGAPHDLVLAEGIFAAEIIARPARARPARRRLLRAPPPLVTFVWRLLRDLSERRKPPWTLVRRGLALMRDEPRVVAEAQADGAR